jgi:hypothetical protein
MKSMNREQLKTQLTDLRIDPTAYCLSGGLPNECLVLNQEPNGIREVYYSERGQKSNLRLFDSEDKAVQYFLDVILHDSAVRRI